jgi:aspartate aminotransferase
VKLARAVRCSPPADASLRVTPAMSGRTPSTRGLLLNSPSNPTGVVYTLAELQALVRWAAERRITVVSDEIYSRICFTAERAAGILDLPDALLGDAVLVDGASKAFAMTGWRIGFSWSDNERAARFADLQSQITSGANTPAQHAALAVYRDDQRVGEAVHAMVRVFRRRRDAALAALHEFLPELNAITPDGAFFLFLRVDSFYRPGLEGSTELCHWLLDNAGVALVPGSAFGDDRCVRLSYALAEESIVEGIRRIAHALRETATEAVRV